jgi:hypothetical protein
MAWTFDEGAVYHKAQELPLARAEALIHSSADRFERLAREALAAIVSKLRADGHEPVATAMVGDRAKVLPPLESILKSHPLVHAAEGELYRHALLRATEACRIPACLLPAGKLSALAATTLGVSPANLAAQLAAIGKASGRPWAKDQKEATLAAWIALARG